MTIEEKYMTLGATIRGRKEGLESFVRIMKGEQTHTVQKSQIEIAELNSLIELMETFENK